MAASLSDIIRAAVNDDFVISVHYLQERQGRDNRPWPSDILFGLMHDAPRIIRDDRGLADPRGAVCELLCEAADRQEFRIRVNYERRPMVMVTAFWQETHK